MEWLDRHVSSAQIALEQAPEVFQPVRVDTAIDVPLRVIHKFMHEAIVQQIVPDSVVRVDLGTVPHLLENFALQSFAPDVRNDFAANLPKVAVKDALHSGLAEIQISELVLAANLAQFQLAALVHVDSLAAYECFISLNLAPVRVTQLEQGFVL